MVQVEYGDEKQTYSLNAFKVAIRKMDVCGLLDNNLNCYDLCKT